MLGAAALLASGETDSPACTIGESGLFGCDVANSIMVVASPYLWAIASLKMSMIGPGRGWRTVVLGVYCWI